MKTVNLGKKKKKIGNQVGSGLRGPSVKMYKNWGDETLLPVLNDFHMHKNWYKGSLS